jgi:hypothetical protein
MRAALQSKMRKYRVREEWLPDVTDIILCACVTPSNGLKGVPPKKNRGLAIKITPKKLKTDTSHE